MICPSCQKSQPLAFRCENCGAQMMQATYQAAAAPPIMDEAFSPAPIPDNPYRAPQRGGSSWPPAVAMPTEVLAGRDARLAAAIIDYLCWIVVAIPGIAGFLYAESSRGAATKQELASLAFVLGLGMLGIVQATYLVRDGQTIGKKMMRIQIVDHAGGQVPPWTRVLGMRYLVTAGLRQVPFYYFADVLLIFGSNQRCIHDYLAGTKVIEAPQDSMRQ